MSFTPDNQLRPDPDVKIFFTGLLVLQPLADKTCEVFVDRSAPDHHLSIEVRRKEAGKPDRILMRHLGPLSFTEVDPAQPPKHGLFIRVSPTPKGVTAFSGPPTNGNQKLTLAMDMFKIHEVQTGPVDSLGGRPSIVFDEAIFYTADTVPDNSATLKKKKAGSVTKPQPEFARIIAANIYLDAANRVATLSWNQDGRDVLLDLKKINGISYEIYIDNEPCYEDDSAGAPIRHDEFAEYYKIFPEIPTDEQFILDFPNPPDRGSTRTPCMSVLLNG